MIITWVLLTETISEMKIKKKFNVQEKKKTEIKYTLNKWRTEQQGSNIMSLTPKFYKLEGEHLIKEDELAI